MNIRQILKDTVVSLLLVPPVIAILTPWMIYAVGLTWEQYIVWVSGGLFIQVPLNYAMVLCIKVIRRFIPVLF